ncbi:MAG: helicase HerA-like domain-containing protein [Vulcanimicrobiota bacterium]
MQLKLGLDSNQLTTHGVIFGMTGSGKTGLAVGLLEELVGAGVPLFVVDPKGDLTNLGLLFPECLPEQLAEWLPSGTDFSELSQRLQRERLQAGILPSQVAALRDRMELRIFTPGSRAGLSIDLLGRFSRPEPSVLDDSEARSQIISGLIQGLLALVGVEADPLRSPQALVLGQIVDQAWEAGQDLSLEDLVLRLVDPPFKKVGVFPLDTFYPSQARLDLAMQFNSLLAGSGFSAWSQGQPLEPARLIQPADPAKVPVNLFYLAHLSESERMFFVSLLLSRLLGWSRSLPGSSQLRSLVYFDEVAGYMPPHPANPASKQPLLTMLKQARAVGLGLVLATQNPVDVDYKALSNASNWWIGRLQTTQDRERVADGLTLAQAGLDRQALRQQFETLQPRQFIYKSGASAPTTLATRTTLCWLRGPLTKAEIPRLQPQPERAPSAPPSAPPPRQLSTLNHVPPIPSGFAQAFLDPEVVFSQRLAGQLNAFAEPCRPDGARAWRPALWGEVALRFDEEKGGFVLDELHHYVFFPLGERLPERWLRLPLEAGDLLSSAPGPGIYQPLPGAFDEAGEFKAAQQAMLDDVFKRVTSSQWICAELKLYGAGGESEQDFRQRVEQAIQDRVDAQVSKLHVRVDKEVAQLQERLARYEGKLDNLRNESQRRQTESLWNAGAAVLGFFTGKKRSLNTAINAVHRSGSAQDRVTQSENELALLQQKIQDVQDQLQAQVEAIEAREGQAREKVEARPVRLDRGDIRLNRFGILWIPVSRRL